MALPSLVVEADFTTPPLVTPTNWTDLSSRARSASIKQGRQRVLDRTEVGAASVTLDNRDRVFDSSAGWGSMPWGDFPWGGMDARPMNHIRIRAIKDGVTYDLFRGFARSWPQEWPGQVDAISVLEAEDAFALMARYELEGNAIAEMGSGAHINSVLTTFGWPEGSAVPPGKTWWILGAADSKLGTNTYLGQSLRFVDTGKSTIMATTLTGNLLDHLLNVAENTEGGTFYVSPSGDVTFAERPSPFAPSVATWGDATGELPYFDLTMGYDDAEIYNDVRVTRRGDTAPYTAKDQTSITRYGPRTLPLTDVLFSTTQQAQDDADQLLGQHKDPIQHPVRMVMRPKSDSPLWPYILGARFGTKITVRRRPPGGGDPIQLDCLILGINYELSPDLWEITWDIAPAQRIIAGAWYLGVAGRSELGSTTKLG